MGSPFIEVGRVRVVPSYVRFQPLTSAAKGNGKPFLLAGLTPPKRLDLTSPFSTTRRKGGTEPLIGGVGSVGACGFDGRDTRPKHGKMLCGAENIDLNGFGVQVWGEKE
ncbi:MAG: hypothetical protein J0I06_00450 [Planctomycetes bacterium]|nr:hypothetical protein [Planctomycetota bacterium]